MRHGRADSVGGLIVHEWIAERGGSENVLEAMFAALPDSDIRCLWTDAPGRFPSDRLQESWLARTPLRRSKIAALPFMPVTWRGMRVRKELDWMLVSSHLFAHHATLHGSNADVPKYSYVHTPARYIWTPSLDRRGAGLLPRAVSPAFRALDRKVARGQVNVAANSEFVRERIRDCWGVDSDVIYPPVDVARIQWVREWSGELNDDDASVFATLPERFVLGASRFVPYKRLDVVLQLAAAAGEAVVIAGSGPDEGRLRQLAADLRVNAIFVVNPSDSLLFALYQKAAAFIFPAIEDFGIMPVEAMATGTPVLVNRIGGAAESVLDGRTGAHIDLDDLKSAVTSLQDALKISSAACEARASEFSTAVFHSRLRNWMGL